MRSRIDALDAEQLATGSRWLLRKQGREVALFHAAGHRHAVDDSCTHAGVFPAPGRLEVTMLTCRAHGSRFDLASGCALGGRGMRRTYPVRVQGGRIQIDVGPPDEPAGNAN